MTHVNATTNAFDQLERAATFDEFRHIFQNKLGEEDEKVISSMWRLGLIEDTAFKLAQRAEEKRAGRKAVFLGTRYAKDIIEQDVLRIASEALGHSALKYDVMDAARVAASPGNEPDRETGAIIILDENTFARDFPDIEDLRDFESCIGGNGFLGIAAANRYILDTAWL